MQPIHKFSLFLLLLVVTISSCTKSDMEGSKALTDFSSTGSSVGGGGAGSNSGVLTAGEWNDMENWDFWKNLMANDTFRTYQQQWGFSTNEKWTFTILNATQQPIADVVISAVSNGMEVWKGKTNRFGKLEMAPGILSTTLPASLQYRISYNNQLYSSGALMPSERNININLPVSNSNISNVDVMVVVDATGSMSDEIKYLKNELLDVLNRADNLLPGTLRFSSIFYRDFGDEYVTKVSPFTNNKTTIVDFVKEQQANGGGDFPEAIEEALRVAMEQAWSTTARSRILFLIADAPVHDDIQKMNLLQQQIKLAASKGIIVIPVSASGIDKPTEFLFRSMAQATNGTYTFLTNDSGIGNSHIAPSIGNYQVEFLNNLMVRLIVKYGGQ